MVARTAEAGSATKSVPLTVARPPSEVEDLLQILQSDLLEEGPPTCILSPEGEMVYANKAYHRLAGPLAEAGAAPSQSGIGLMSPAGDISQIGRAHVWTPVTNAHIVCPLLPEQKNKTT